LIRECWQWWPRRPVTSAQKSFGALEYLWMLLAKGAHRVVNCEIGWQNSKLATCFKIEQIKASVYREPVFVIFGEPHSRRVCVNAKHATSGFKMQLPVSG
jgi:hypothetical protein